MSTLEHTPEAWKTKHPEDEVSKKADQIVESAGEAVVAATDGIEEPTIKEGLTSSGTMTKIKHGKLTSVAETSDWGLGLGGNTIRVEVAKKPGLVARVKQMFKRSAPVEGDKHAVDIYGDGMVAHTTSRPSVLGGRVDKRSVVSTSLDGTKSVSYEVTRYDDEGREIERGRRDALKTYAHQPSVHSVAADRAREKEIEEIKDPQERERRRASEREYRERREAQRDVVLDTAQAISGRVDEALGGDKGDLAPVKGVDRKGKEVPQIPKGTEKHVDAADYQDRKKAEREAKKWDL